MVMQLTVDCALCDRPYDPKMVQFEAIDQALFGREPFEVCITCGRYVSPSRQTLGYRDAWIRRL